MLSLSSVSTCTTLSLPESHIHKLRLHEKKLFPVSITPSLLTAVSALTLNSGFLPVLRPFLEVQALPGDRGVRPDPVINKKVPNISTRTQRKNTNGEYPITQLGLQR